MSQKSSIPQVARFVSQALMSDTGYIRDSAIISSEARRSGFVADQSVINREHLTQLLEDFAQVGQDIVATIRQGFSHETQQPKNVVELMRSKFPRLFGDPLDRAQSAQQR